MLIAWGFGHRERGCGEKGESKEIRKVAGVIARFVRLLINEYESAARD